jgi:hypothetical protein
MSQSGTIELVIFLVAERDTSDLIAVHASHEREAAGVLSDAELIEREVLVAGVSDLLGLEEDSWRDCPPGLWRVGGHFWHETHHSPDYGVDYDGGFEVDHAEPLTLEALVGDWVAHAGDRAFLAALCAEARDRSRTPGGRAQMLDRVGAVAAVLAVLQTVVEDGHAIG